MASKFQTVVARVQLGAYAEAALLARAREVRSEYNTTGRAQTGAGKIWSYLPRGDYPICPFYNEAWRVILGGVTALAHLAGLDGKTLEPMRFAAVFLDAPEARAALVCERTMVRRVARFYLLESQWWVSLRYQRKESMILVKTSKPRARQQWKSKRKHPRRWQTAPASWPRDKWGNLLSDAAVARMRADSAARDFSDSGHTEPGNGPSPA